MKVIVVFGEHVNGEIYVMTLFAFVCFDIIVSYPIHLGLSVKSAIWEHTFCCQKPISDHRNYNRNRKNM